MTLKTQPGRLQIDQYRRRFTTRILYSDMDAFRHLNNGATGRYFEEGRSDLNMHVFGTACMTNPADGLQLLFANIIIDYLAQAYYPGTVEIGTSISRIGNSSWTVVQGAFQNGECFALADGILVKAIHGKPVGLSPEERMGLERLMLATDQI